MIYLENGKNDLYIPNKGDGVTMINDSGGNHYTPSQPSGDYYTKAEINALLSKLESECCDVIDCGEY